MVSIGFQPQGANNSDFSEIISTAKQDENLTTHLPLKKYMRTYPRDSKSSRLLCSVHKMQTKSTKYHTNLTGKCLTRKKVLGESTKS
jgi:hypothetical protein